MLLGLAAAAVLAAAAPATAAADSQWFTADVVRTAGRWTADRRQIVTDATLRTTDGRELVVSQLGGTAGGYTQIVWHGQPALERGMRVRIEAHPPSSGRGAWIADDVIVERSLGTVAPFVRTVTKKSGRPLYWAKSCIELRRAAAGTSAVQNEDAIISAAIAAWNDGTRACSYLDLVDLGSDTREVGVDRANLVIVRDNTWCRPAVDGEDERCFNNAAAGVTTVTFVDDPDDERDGEIIDADIELNNVTFRITDGGQGAGTAACDAELINTLVHELGHLIGLEHTCRGAADPPRTDGTGAAVPLCGETSDPLLLDATMYPYQDCGETKKATPEADDIAAVCNAYPAADDPGECAAPDDLTGGCCGVGRGAPGTAAALALLVIAGLIARRRSDHSVRLSDG